MKSVFIKLTAAALAALMLTGCTVPIPEPGPAAVRPQKTGFAVFTAERAEQPKNPNAAYTSESKIEKDPEGYRKLGEEWSSARAKRRMAANNAPDISNFTRDFYAELMRENEDKNLVCSPVSVYIALAMLAEITGGETRAEILTALGEKDIVKLREGVAALLEAETVDDGVTTSLIANSVWLNESIDYVPETLRTLAEIYSASSFSGDPEDEAFKQALRDWVNENTGGLLKDAAQGLRPGSVITLASTIYYKGRWEYEFPKEWTEDKVFHAPSGDVTVPFMRNTILSGTAVIGDNFAAVELPLKEGAGSMWLFLPAEGLSPADILTDAESVIFSEGDAGGDYRIEIELPKFDVNSDLDLIPAIKALGVKSCFGAADFTPLAKEPMDASVSSIRHAARVKIDEEGLEAAAYTVITADGCALVIDGKNIEIRFERPFLFAITGTSGLPLFMGAVNEL